MGRWCSRAGRGNPYFKQSNLKFLNNSIDSNFNNRLWLNDSPQTNDVCSDIKGLIDLRKRFHYNPLIGYINTNSRKEKVLPLREVSPNAPIDVICVDESKLGTSFSRSSIYDWIIAVSAIQERQKLKGWEKLVYLRESFIAKRIPKFETKKMETICIEITIAERKWCILFAYRPPNFSETEFFEGIWVTLNKALNEYGKLLLAEDLNKNTLRPTSDSRNHSSDLDDTFSLTNLVTGFTCFKSDKGRAQIERT